MAADNLLRSLRTFWWLILVVVAAALIGSLVYSLRSERIYQASATAFIHPVATDQSTSASNEIQVLAYSTFTQTFTSLAQSASLLQQSAGDIHMDPAAVSKYTVVPSALPGSTVIQIAVQGPDPAFAAQLANRMVGRLAGVSKRYYPVYAVTQLDTAVPSTTPIKPRTSRDLIYAGVAGLIVGLVLAALMGARRPDPTAVSAPEWVEQPDQRDLAMRIRR